MAASSLQLGVAVMLVLACLAPTRGIHVGQRLLSAGLVQDSLGSGLMEPEEMEGAVTLLSPGLFPRSGAVPPVPDLSTPTPTPTQSTGSDVPNADAPVAPVAPVDGGSGPASVGAPAEQPSDVPSPRPEASSDGVAGVATTAEVSPSPLVVNEEGGDSVDAQPKAAVQAEAMNMEPEQGAKALPASGMTSAVHNGDWMDQGDEHVRSRNNALATERVLVAVVTAPTHFDARSSIRHSWGRMCETDFGIPVRFFVGIPARGENQTDAEYADLDQRITNESGMVRFDSFVESYHNLTSKALAIFDWAYEQNYTAVMKVDDDAYLRVPRLLEFLERNAPLATIYGGQFVNGTRAVVSNPASKWYMKDQYPFDTWPDYANGPGVVLGSVALKFLHDNKDSLPLYRVDDAAVGIWLKDLDLNRARMTCDSYVWTLRGDSVWVCPVNKFEMIRLMFETDFVLEACVEGTLCEGGPYVPGWDSFSVKEYVDLIPRL